MPRTKQKLCMGCLQPFSGRADAKTCSAKCRKRFQRVREMVEADYELRHYNQAPVPTQKFRTTMVGGMN